MNFTQTVKSAIAKFPCNRLIVANELHQSIRPEIPEQIFYKAIGRLADEQAIVRLTTGIYYRPKISRFGAIPISDEEISQHYTQSHNGMTIGYHMYNAKGLTTQIGKKIQILSIRMKESRKNIGNVSITRIGIKPTKEISSVIEALEILQNYEQIEDLNPKALLSYMESFVESYSDDVVNQVLAKRRYKKSTIAFLTAFLQHYKIRNTLNRHLSTMSTYKIPDVEALYESA